MLKKELQTPESCLEAVKINGNNLAFIRKDLRTPELVREAIKTTGSAIGLIPKKDQTAELALLAISTDPSSYLRLREDLQSDKQIKRACILVGSHMLKQFKEKDFDLCVEAVRQDSSLVSYISFSSSPKRTPEEMNFLYKVISEKGIYETLMFVPASFQTQEMFFTKDRQSDGTSLLDTIKKFPDLFSYLNEKFQTKETVEEAFKYRRYFFKYIREDLRTEEMREDIHKNGDVYESPDDFTNF